MIHRQIVALGGGGFREEPDNLVLDRFILELAHKKRPKICFVGAASGDSSDYIERFYRSMSELNCEPTHLSLFNPPRTSIRDFILTQNVISVGGGNTKNFMYLCQAWELDRILKEAYELGIVLSGMSAGSLCWFEEGITDSITGKLLPINCLGFLPGSNCVHYDHAGRRSAYHLFIKNGMTPGYACDDGVALHAFNGVVEKFVSSRPSARAYKVYVEDGEVREEVIMPTFLTP